MSLSSELGISSGGLNIKCKLSDSSILDVLCGLGVGHADHADLADCFCLGLLSPTDCTDYHRYWTYAGWDFADLIIRNIGPIRNVDIELKKVNVFIADLESAIKKVRPIKSQGFAIPFAIIRIAKCRFCGNLLVTCRFILIFLVVSRKKRIFAIQFYGLYIWLD